MRYALISDVHANLPALQAVLADIGGRPEVAAVYHLVDLVGYAPWPNEVVELIRARAIPGVGGNYDSTTATDYRHCGCRYEDARQEELSHLSYEWTRAHVSPDVIAFGHTHKPWHRTIEGMHFVNTGSVGRPKDGDWRAGYVIVDFGKDANVEIVRVEYDVAQAASAIRKSDLPDAFAEYLETGGKPATVR